MDYEDFDCGNLSNFSNSTSTDGCESNLYIQIMGTILFVIVWPFVVLDVPIFPIGRPAAALFGGLLMVVFNVVTQEGVYVIEGEKGNLQTLYLLIGMMLLSYYFDREGLLTIISLKIFGKASNSSFSSILWKVCVLTAVLSAFITNDAACVLITPLILHQFHRQGRDRKELLPLTLGIATSANIGSAATVFGNPQNSFIGSNADVALIDFIIAELPAAIFGVLVNIGLLYLFHYKIIFGKKESNEKDEDKIEADVEIALAELNNPKTPDEQEQAGDVPPAVSIHQGFAERNIEYDKSDHPNHSSQLAVERSKLTNDTSNAFIQRSESRSSIKGFSNGLNAEVQQNVNSDVVIEEFVNNLVPIKERSIKEKLFLVWLVFISIFMVLLLAIPPPPTVPFEFNLGLVPMAAAILTMLVDTILNKKFANDAMQRIDWTVILLFMGLFVWIEGFQNTCFPKIVFDYLKPYMNINTVPGVLLFSVFVTFGSNIFSNVPLVIIVVDELDLLCGEEKCDSTKVGGLILAWVSTVAGNLTLIGSIANLLVAEKARAEPVKYTLTFFRYLRFGFISTLIITFASLPIIYFLGVGASMI